MKTIEIAREAWEKAGEGWVHPGWFADREKAFKEFEALVRADEAERIAKMCDAAEKESEVTVQQCMDKNEPTLALVAKGAAYQCKLLVAAIRARNIK